MDNTRVLIADDHEFLRQGLIATFQLEPDIEVVGEAESAEDAIRLAAELQPDVVIMDITMPGPMNGIDATRSIVTTSPHIRVLILTMGGDGDDDLLVAALRAGARGYVLKSGPPSEIVAAIRMGAGPALFGRGVAERIIEYFSSTGGSGPPDLFPELTDREREILTLIADGENNTAIAQKLYLSPKTVRNHVSNIFSKLQVADRAQAIVRARRAGLTND